MPVYEVRRRTVLQTATVTAANETEARTLARDVFQQDAAIAALAADVTRQPYLEPYDRERDYASEARYEETEDRESEDAERYRRGLQGVLSDPDGLEPW